MTHRGRASPKEKFLALLVPELRNPLAPVLNRLRILAVAATDAPAGEPARRRMERQIHYPTTPSAPNVLEPLLIRPA